MTKIIPFPAHRCYYERMNETHCANRITSHTLVEDLVQDHPAAVLVFVRHGMHCPGCYMAPFHTLADSARAYAVSVEPLVRDLNRAIENTTP